MIKFLKNLFKNKRRNYVQKTDWRDDYNVNYYRRLF
jgi:hypothetical protein